MRTITVNDAWRLAPWADLLYAADRPWATSFYGCDGPNGKARLMTRRDMTRIVSSPDMEPVLSLAEAREQLRIDATGSPPTHPEDALVQAYIETATNELDGADRWLGRALVTRHQLPFVDYLRLAFAWAGFPSLDNYAQRNDVRRFIAEFGWDLMPC